MSRKHPGSRFYAALNQRRWQLLRLKAFARDSWRCRKCNKAGALECDHIIPLHKGGAPYDADNLQTLCRGCHIAKTAEDAGRGPDLAREAWRELLSDEFGV